MAVNGLKSGHSTLAKLCEKIQFEIVDIYISTYD